MIAFADALVIVALGGLGGLAASGSALLPVAWIAATTPMLVRSDLRSRRLPNSLTLPGLGILVVSLVWTAFVDPAGALVGGVATAVTALVAYLAALTPGLGMGDAKLGTLAVASIALISVDLVVVVVVVASLVALAAVGRARLVLRRRDDRRVPLGATTVAFGPCLLLGYWVGLAVACFAA
ncbi:MAG: hypothetical protein JWP75_1176 [Frondihabitans sp.]|nr:hypothetical protein [Frondihabitans sp.]